MFLAISDTVKKNKSVILIALIFFILPFFWLKPGEMDLGGDDGRLFLYDPLGYITNVSIYDVVREGRGKIEPDYGYIPYLTIFALLKIVFSSPTILIAFLNGTKLAGGFSALYLIVTELLLQAYGTNKKNLISASGILAGVFYVVAQGSFHLAFNWETALTTHNQFFIYPILFYFLLKYLLTHRYNYLWAALLISFVFSPNFGLQSMPPFFAFWPLALSFLFLYIKVFGGKSIPWIGVSIGILLFFGVHAFHIISQAASLFDSGSFTNIRVFDPASIYQDGVHYFLSVAPTGMATLNLLLPSVNKFFGWLSFIPAFSLLIGLMINKKKEVLLIADFFIVSFFLVTANITDIGFEFYKRLFYISGFSMFRVFYVKWLYVFVFFYALFFGFSLYSIIQKTKRKYALLVCAFVFVVLCVTGLPLFLGEPVNKAIIRGTGIKLAFEMDPLYEQVLNYIRRLPDDGKILTLPMMDFNYQVINGKNGSAYVGPSTISHLTTKYSFTGEQHFGFMGHNPYNDIVKKYAKERGYEKLNMIFSLMNIHYILYNKDPWLYEHALAQGPYIDIRNFFPKTQKGYRDFINKFPVKEIYKNGSYILYEFDRSVYNPTIFVPEGVYISDTLSFDKKKVHLVFIDNSTCRREAIKKLCDGTYIAPEAKVTFKMINPALYELTIQKNGSQDPMLLVMQHTFHSKWKVVKNGENIAEDSHILVNGYANGWVIKDHELSKRGKYTLFISLDTQKYFWYGLAITVVSLFVIIVFVLNPPLLKRG